ncbi:GNAT family N-acetyltransferase [Synechococcus sp. CS-1325]|uniref:GNAT family N-acetyltransferase n=1 Tax=unclassified Synechococcus TaxID=2626047 RepID=UPI000DB3ABD9|nr:MULTISPECIES: GNAT family N-acetyltransferase [unclassified Synechococcus]PZV01577.1 MAG: GNAT family N-acetyltransferase [Cyanobium sp.]MCT0200298.1 GNAT family N-acetyltransferase [Synechococcus sp. CS-1325]MCT0214309.1 GNAT family N-acetyltransferase [Synechococcus sp. CS-1326]MCT0230128.1 GNAT family N-acetyltransferase [Synechococcus sp. CS-1324]MCT0234473.1 GNAT family N-acetyltransferase [Synechococcus sp. CS-1327]
MTPLRPLGSHDIDEVIAVYRDAVLSQAPRIYSHAQVKAWAELAAGRASLPLELARGIGMVSTGGVDRDGSPSGPIEAFALLDPVDRISLLYCRGRSCRQGRGRALLKALESEARRAGAIRLRTEASFLSRPLFERLGWQVDGLETLPLGGVIFHRFLMSKPLLP